jgi:hypothetical protein
MKVAMQLIKNTSIYLVIVGVVFFAAGMVQASEVIQKWVASYNAGGASAIAVDSSGNVYVTGGGGVAIKYDPNGNPLWITSGEDGGFGDIAVDSSGNVYVTGGISAGEGGFAYYMTVKYNANGVKQWASRYNYNEAPGPPYDFASAIALDSSGNVYVTGYSIGLTPQIYGYATIKYDGTNGNPLWVARYGGVGYSPGPGDSMATDIALDSLGNVYVTGISYIYYDSGECYGYATIKYGTNGNQLWARSYCGGDLDNPPHVAVDSWGDVYVTGLGGTIKYDAGGTPLKWLYTGGCLSTGRAIAVDSAGNVYVTGSGAGGYATVKYDMYDNKLWDANYIGPGNGNDKAYAIALDNLGNVYVTGESNGNGTDYDYATIKYDGTNGNQKWVMRYDGTGHIYDRALAIALDTSLKSSGHVYVTGQTDYTNYTTIKYSQCGECGDEDHPYPPGDLNKDCIVNFIDQAILADNWLVSTAPDPNCDC